jgi:hypothetical protein
MRDSVESTAKLCGLTDKQIATEVELFLSVQGEDRCLHALNLMGKYQGTEASKGLHAGTPLRAWRWATQKLVADMERERRFDKESQVQETAERAYQEAKEKGYNPDKETLLAQIEDLYDRGEISLQDYTWAIRGLEVVHGYVERAQSLEDVPF